MRIRGLRVIGFVSASLSSIIRLFGRTVTGWPERVISRGREVVADGELKGVPGMGRRLGRTGGWAATPTGRLAPEMDPATNFGASIP